MPQRIEKNVQTGEVKILTLTPAEIAAAVAAKAAEDAEIAARPRDVLKELETLLRLDQSLLDKIRTLK